jgi:hypothetical protein
MKDGGAAPPRSTIRASQCFYDGPDAVSISWKVIKLATRQAIDVKEANQVSANESNYALAA